MTQAELQQMIADYLQDRLPEMNATGRTQTGRSTFNDAESCWFDVETLIAALGKNLTAQARQVAITQIKNSGINGVRFHYAIYPNNDPGSNAGRHTLVLVPTEPDSSFPDSGKDISGSLANKGHTDP